MDISSTQEFRGRESIFETESIRDHFFVNKMSFRVSLDSGEHGPCVFQHWTRNLHMVNFKEKINKMCDDKLLSRVCPYQNHVIWHWPLSCSWKSLVITIQKHIWRNMLPFLGKGRGCSKKILTWKSKRDELLWWNFVGSVVSVEGSSGLGELTQQQVCR